MQENSIDAEYRKTVKIITTLESESTSPAHWEAVGELWRQSQRIQHLHRSAVALSNLLQRQDAQLERAKVHECSNVMLNDLLQHQEGAAATLALLREQEATIIDLEMRLQSALDRQTIAQRWPKEAV